MGLFKDNVKGVVLALLSSTFIGGSFIIKKMGLKRTAAFSGVRPGVGGYSYLLEPLWWVWHDHENFVCGLVSCVVVVGEASNFVAYALVPAVLVTPLGALSIIVSAVLGHFILKEKSYASVGF